MTTGWKQALIPSTATIRDAVKAIDTSRVKIALVVADGGRLLGTVTDGDVRRALLRGTSLDQSAADIMNRKPVVAGPDASRQQLLAVMKETTLRCVPLVDARQHVVDVAMLGDLLQGGERDNLVVIMAGGPGTRLSPITLERPKPMVHVGPKPILETILECFTEYGFKKFYFSVNYKAEMVKEYFGDGARWGVSIGYLEESERRGTAGPLSLLPVRPRQPLLVMNGDLLTKINLQQLLDFHGEHRAMATMCVREYDFQVPYGVVRTDGHRVASVDEKPVHRFFVNAGIYALEPAALDFIPREGYFDMTTLFERLIERKCETAAFPIREYWLDIGRLDDLERAQADYGGLFK